MADVWANSMACHPRATCHIAGWCHLANSMPWSQSYIAGCCNRVNSTACYPRATYHIATHHWLLGEFTVMIPEPHATLQGAVTWRNQCHDRATLQDARIPFAIKNIENRFWSYFRPLCRVSTTPGNPGNFLEFENPLGNPGNLLEFKWSSWKFLCNDRKLMMWYCLCIEECNIKMLLML